MHRGVKVRILEGPYMLGGKPTADAASFYAALVGRLDEFRRCAARELLEKYNGVWQDEEIGPLDEVGFIAHLGNPSVVLYDEAGAGSVYFSDGGMFAGHLIEIGIDGGEPVNVSIAG
jgi:hypothetical protein